MSDADRAGEQIFMEAGDARLAGEVWHPESDLQAGVVMIGGSGPTERSNDGYFVAYRDQFTGHGIAVLWYDKRGLVDQPETGRPAPTTGRHPRATMTIHVVPGADHRLRTGADAVPAAHHLAYLRGWIKSALRAGAG
jgi:hypothetical protein